VVKILEAAQEAQAVLRHAAPVEEEEEETSVTPRGSPELVRQHLCFGASKAAATQDKRTSTAAAPAGCQLVLTFKLQASRFS